MIHKKLPVNHMTRIKDESFVLNPIVTAAISTMATMF